MKKKYKSLLSDTVIFAIGNLGSKLILFFLVPLYTNYLTTTEYGTADFITTFSQLIIPFVSLSISDAVIRFALKKDEKKEDVFISAFVVILFMVIVTAIVIPIVGMYSIVSPWQRYLYFYVILSCISETEKSYLKAMDKNKAFAIISIIQTVVLALTNYALLVWIRTGVKGYLMANICSLGAACIITFFAANIIDAFKKGRFRKNLLRQMIAYSWPLVLNNISWWVIHSSDKIMIERMIGTSALGLYTAATKIPSLINVIIAIFTQAWGLSTIKEVESDNDVSFFSSVFSAYSILTFGAGIFFTSFIKWFMGFYVGSEFQEAWKLTPMLLTAAVFYAISSYFGSLYAAIRKTVNSMWTTVLCASVNVVFNYIFIKLVGAYGAVIGTVISYFIIAHVRMGDVKRKIPLKIDFARYIINAILLLAHSTLVTLEWQADIVSALMIVFFVIININEIRKLIKSLLSLLKGTKGSIR